MRRRASPELVSVIIPVRNEAAYVADQLAALAAQTYQGAWELVVVDNGCRDGTIEIVEHWRMRLPAVQIVDARGRRRGLNHARNRGAAAARGELLCFCDGDDVVSSGWLRAHVEAARAADIVSGCADHELLNDEAQKSWRPVAPQLELHRHPGYLTYASGGNCAIWADVAAELGWDERFRFGSSDKEFSFRAQLASRRIVFAPDAVIHLRHRSSVVGLLRQYYAYGKSGAQLYRAFRGHGMPPVNREEEAGWGWLIRRSVYCFRHSPTKRIHWLRHAALNIGRLAGSIRWRVLYL